MAGKGQLPLSGSIAHKWLKDAVFYRLTNIPITIQLTKSASRSQVNTVNIGQENEAEDAPKEDDETPISSLEDSPKEVEDTPKEEEKAAAIVEAKLEDPEDVEVDEGERRSGTCDDSKPAAALSGAKFNEKQHLVFQGCQVKKN